MNTILSETETSFTEKGSRFLNYLFPVSDTDDIAEKLESLKERYPDATHHCYAWRLGPQPISEFANDDGEPSGTAGLPILNSLKSFDVVNALCVSVRYYGGTKLGKPGLIAAYREAAESCLNEAKIGQLIPITRFYIEFPYQEQKTIDQLVHSYSLKTLQSDYGSLVKTEIEAPSEEASKALSHLKELSYRDIIISDISEGFGVEI